MNELLATCGTIFFTLSNLPVFIDGVKGNKNSYPVGLIVFVLAGAICLGSWAALQGSMVVVGNYVFCFVTWALAWWRRE